MGSSFLFPDVGSFLSLVLREAHSSYRSLYLGSRHATPVADGSTDEFCVEVYVANGAAESCHHSRLAFSGAGSCPMGCLRSSDRCCLCVARPLTDAGLEVGKAS